MSSGSVNPNMIILARESRGMSQRSLAEQSRIPQSRLSKYENGQIPVEGSDVTAISNITGYRKPFFYQQSRIIGLGSSLLFNRKQKSTPIGTQRQVQARVNIARMQLERLLRAAEVDSDRRLERLDIDTCGGDPRAVARRVRAALGIPLGPIDSVTRAIESAGGLVVLCDFGTQQIDGAHLWLPDAPPLFFMNDNAPGDKHRFSLAHELGHAVMHEFPSGDIEKQANEFAAEFLMPGEEISSELQQLNIERLARLKQRWKVSMSALIYNAERLGCITETRKRIMYATLRSIMKGQEEPIRIEREEPLLIKQLLDIHRDALGYTEEDFNELLMMDEPDFLTLPEQPSRMKFPLKLDQGPLKFDDFKRAAQ